jgi:two-component sensor histidine kinase
MLNDLPFLCHAVALCDEGGSRVGAMLFCHDIARIHEAADRRIAAEQEVTRTLVKELHHRIKNSLQATVGLLRQHILENHESAEALEKAISQLLSIAAVHGIQARMHEDRIYLCSVVEEVVRAARVLTYLHIESPVGLRLFALQPHHAVPIALIVNELVTNAIKHTDTRQDARIVVSMASEGDNAVLTIANDPARPGSELDMSTGAGLGAGLRLVRSLLPHKFATLTIAPHGSGVLAQLRLLSPIVQREECELTAEEPGSLA